MSILIFHCLKIGIRIATSINLLEQEEQVPGKRSWGFFGRRRFDPGALRSLPCLRSAATSWQALAPGVKRPRKNPRSGRVPAPDRLSKKANYLIFSAACRASAMAFSSSTVSNSPLSITTLPLITEAVTSLPRTL